MESIVRTLAFTLGPRGITVNGLGLGLYDTESSRYALGLDHSFDARAEISRQRTALRRMGKPSDVAGVAGFLCTEEAGYVTGQMIMVDGGIGIASPQ
jgi:NAD(P)-dependent dehydrogenase (short-subunit alcohol dehydrogenase family)